MTISILSTFYNDKEMLKRMMDSVLEQDYPDIEHVITDAASTDGSVELIKEYQSKYEESGKKLVWLSERDRGLHDGDNKAAALATGDYMMFGSDPYTGTDIISTFAAVLEKGNLDYSYGGIYFHKDGKIIRTWSGKPGNWRLGWMAATPTLCFRRALWEKYGPFDLDYVSASDYKFQIRLFKDKTLRSESIQRPLVCYYAGGVSNNGIKSNLVSIKENFRVMREEKVPFGWFTVICKMFIASFAYIFHSHKKIDAEVHS